MKKVFVACALVAAFISSIGMSACGGDDGEATGSKGGTMKVSYGSFPDYLDPALSYTAEGWTAMGEVYVPLLTYRHAEGVEGGEVVPGLAKAMPEVSDDGKTYTLFLRPGLKYSNGKPVKASDFTSTVERLFKINSPGSPFYTGIVGAEEFAKTKQGGIPGIKTDDRSGEIAIELTAPSSTFTNELGMLFVALLPPDTPAEDQTATPPPGTGPYMITKTKPGRSWVYERNPEWARANSKAMPDYPSGSMDRVEAAVVSNPESQVDDIERGRVQWMQNLVPANRYAEVKNTFEGTQFKSAPTNSSYFFWMNTTAAPFDDLEVRQAVNHAVNGRALERVYAGQLTAGQQVLPPGMPGYEQFELYPYDLAKAKQMVKEAAPADMDITVWTNTESPSDEAGEYLDGVLTELGFDTTLKVINADNYFALIGNETTPDLDIGYTSWFQDYPHPNNFLQPLLSGESIAPTNNTNLSRFEDPAIDREIVELAERPLGPEEEAAYAGLDRELMEAAPIAPYGSIDVSTFVSEEIDLDKVIFNPTLGQFLTSFEYK